MLCSRRYAGGFLHHGMLGDTALYIKEECKSYNKKGKVCSKRYDFGNNHILAQKNGKAGSTLSLNIYYNNLRMFLKYIDFYEHNKYNNRRRDGVTEWCTDMQE